MYARKAGAELYCNGRARANIEIIIHARADIDILLRAHAFMIKYCTFARYDIYYPHIRNDIILHVCVCDI